MEKPPVVSEERAGYSNDIYHNVRNKLQEWVYLCADFDEAAKVNS